MNRASRHAGRAVRKALRLDKERLARRRAAVVALARDIGPHTPPDKIVRTR